jgi:hypothetical protein
MAFPEVPKDEELPPESLKKLKEHVRLQDNRTMPDFSKDEILEMVGLDIVFSRAVLTGLGEE